MVYAGKLELKMQAQELRKKGFSIKEIEKQLKVSRSSVSLWVRDVILTKRQLEELYLNRKTGNLKGSIVAAGKKKRAREVLTEKLLQEGISELGSLSEREKFITGVALYFAEGTKADANVSFSNSDPQAIKFMVGWLQDFCAVSKERIRINLYLHENLDERRAKKFWTDVTGLPLEQFRKTYIVKNNEKRFRKIKHEYGVCRITVSDVNLHRKIMGWIVGLFRDYIIIPR